MTEMVNKLDNTEDINYKTLDTQRITNYLSASSHEVTVEDIILHSGADKLRVYPALFELEQSGWLEVVSGKSLEHPPWFEKRQMKTNDR